MAEIIQFEKPDHPDNVAALVAMRDAVDASKTIGFDRETFIAAAGNVWDQIEMMEATGQRDLSGITDEQEKKLEQIGELVAECIRAGVEQERARCAKIADEWLSGQTMVLRAGEMTAQEKRTALAVVAHISTAIRNADS